MAVQRCAWCEGSDAYRHYHDTEWGVPSRDDRHLFELLVLEGAQAGLSWSTVLNRREGYRAAYLGFDPRRVAAFGEGDVARLVADPGIIRNQAKIRSSIANAKAFLDVAGEFGAFSTYLWQFVNEKPLQNEWTALDQIPAVTPLATTISKDLRKRGFGFVGPTIMYAYMQAAGLVNDHLVDCFRHGECARLG